MLRELASDKRIYGKSGRIAIAGMIFAVIAGCTELETATDKLGRDAAKSAVSEVVAVRLPGVSKQMVAPFTDCVVDNAKAREVRNLAKATIVGVDDSTVDIVTDIIQRPETGACIAKAGLQSLT